MAGEYGASRACPNICKPIVSCKKPVPNEKEIGEAKKMVAERFGVKPEEVQINSKNTFLGWRTEIVVDGESKATAVSAFESCYTLNMALRKLLKGA